MCPDGICVFSLDPNTIQCTNNQELMCPKKLPYRCNGSEYIDSINNVNKDIFIRTGICVNDNKSCITNNGCPLYNGKQLNKCQDGLCVIDIQDCNILNSTILWNTIVCSSEQILCSNGSCMDKYEYCPSYINECILKDNYNINEIFMCGDGKCKKNMNDCNIIECPNSNPIVCNNTICVSHYSLCDTLIDKYEYITNNEKKYRCSDNIFRDKPIDCIQDILGTTINIDNNPTTSAIICWDGTIHNDNKYKCPPLPSCDIYHYRLKDGSCSENYKEYDSIKCNDNKILHQATGLCQLKNELIKQEYYGCPGTLKSISYHCPDFSCRGSLNECYIPYNKWLESFTINRDDVLINLYLYSLYQDFLPKQELVINTTALSMHLNNPNSIKTNNRNILLMIPNKLYFMNILEGATIR